MIWHTEFFTLEGQPEDVEVVLEGTYNPYPVPPDSLICIRLKVDMTVQPAAMIFDPINAVLFVHDPAKMRVEDPTPDDISQKYHHKIKRYQSKISGLKYEELIDWAKSL